MSWSIVVAGEGRAVARDVARQVKGIVESTHQSPGERAQAQAASALLETFAERFPGRLVSVTASGHSGEYATMPELNYGSLKVEATTLTALNYGSLKVEATTLTAPKDPA